MNLVDLKTGEKISGEIRVLTKSEVESLKSHKQFSFDWSLEKENAVYQINRKGEKEILGLISLIDYPSELRIHINLIESAKSQRGKIKTIKNIPGCLIAMSCKLSFSKGYDGFVSLVPKTKLVNYYHQTYGFIGVGTQMAVFEQTAQLIIEKYLSDEKI